jgi:uncharacterized delta-60 repeat protein
METEMKKVITYLILLVFAASLSAQAGSLDPTFGTNGIAQFNPGGWHDVAVDVVCLDDGSLLVGVTISQYPSFTTHYGALLKLNSNGTMNLQWGTNGIVSLQCGLNSSISKLEVLPDGKILVAGTTSVTTPNIEFFVARFLADGTPDSTFGTDGYSITSYNTGEEDCNAMAVQADGKIILAGVSWTDHAMLFTRFNANGVLDTTFGNSGYTALNPSVQSDDIKALGLLSDGTIVGMGSQYVSTPFYEAFGVMVKLDADGIPISSFGTNGVLIPAIFTDVSTIYGMHIADDDIYATGYIYNSVNDKILFIAKLSASGIAYPDFGTNGMTLTPPATNNHLSCGLDILVAPDGYIYTCGTTGSGTLTGPRDFIVLRYTMNGQLDPGFNSTGYNVISIGPAFDDANALALQADGKIVLAGFTADLTTTTYNDIALARILTTAPASLISVTPGDIHFGEVGIGDTATQEFVISNTGTAALAYEIAFPDWISTTVLTGTVAAGGAQNISVPFTPSAAMYYSGTIEIVNNSLNQPLVEIEVDGQGTAPTLNPPESLAINTTSGLFTWNVPVNGTPIGYEVYLDGGIQGTTTDLEWQLDGLINGASYVAGVRAEYNAGYSDMVTIGFIYEGSSAEDDPMLVGGMLRNYPNPFIDRTSISFDLRNPVEAELSIYNLKGQKVKSLMHGFIKKGVHNIAWDGEDDRGIPLSSGVYIIRLDSVSAHLTHKLILIK